MKPHQEPASFKAAAAAVAPVTGETAEAMRAATLQAEKLIARLLTAARRDAIPGADSRAGAAAGLPVTAALLASYQAGGRYDSHLQVATLTVTLASLRVRDDAWARCDPEHQDAHLRLWTDVTRLAQPGYVAAPASLLAFTAWQGGKEALASAALDRAQADDPAYSMAGLIRIGIATSLHPSTARPTMTPGQVAAYYASAPEVQAALLTSARAREISGNGPRDPGKTGQRGDTTRAGEPGQEGSLAAARAQQELAARNFPHGNPAGQALGAASRQPSASTGTAARTTTPKQRPQGRGA
jgi:hypothetical protein